MACAVRDLLARATHIPRRATSPCRSVLVRFRVSCFGFRVSGVAFQVLGFGFRRVGSPSWGFGLRGFGFRGEG